MSETRFITGCEGDTLLTDLEAVALEAWDGGIETGRDKTLHAALGSGRGEGLLLESVAEGGRCSSGETEGTGQTERARAIGDAYGAWDELKAIHSRLSLSREEARQGEGQGECRRA